MKNTSGEQIFLERLLNSHSVSGFEEGASRIYEEYVKQYSSVLEIVLIIAMLF